MIDLEKEREAFKVFKERELQPPSEHDLFLTWLYRACRAEDKFLKMKKEIVDLKAQLAELHASRASWVEYSQKIESGEFVLVPKLPTRKGGYYLRDTRLPIGNCMKFWYTHGYGTKHSKFHWFETLEQAQQCAGGAPWFETWYAPYIDSIIESTVDIQKAYRSEEKAMIETLEKEHD